MKGLDEDSERLNLREKKRVARQMIGEETLLCFILFLLGVYWVASVLA